MVVLKGLYFGDLMQPSVALPHIRPQQTVTPVQRLFAASDVALSVQHVGVEETPLLVFELSPELTRFLVKQASTYGPDWSPAKTIYPGIWSQAPIGFEQALLDLIQPDVERYFFARQAKNIVSCYAMAVTDKEQLQVNQRVPHYDSFDPYQLASVLYLCDESFGGTGFYRHKSTDIEKMTEETYPKFIGQLQSEMADCGVPAAEFSGNCDDLFETLFSCTAKLGRLVVYPSALLHTGLVNSAKNTVRDPARGRLTITSFIKY